MKRHVKQLGTQLKVKALNSLGIFENPTLNCHKFRETTFSISGGTTSELGRPSIKTVQMPALPHFVYATHTVVCCLFFFMLSLFSHINTLEPWLSAGQLISQITCQRINQPYFPTLHVTSWTWRGQISINLSHWHKKVYGWVAEETHIYCN